jgi:hypothetical protein
MSPRDDIARRSISKYAAGITSIDSRVAVIIMPDHRCGDTLHELRARPFRPRTTATVFGRTKPASAPPQESRPPARRCGARPRLHQYGFTALARRDSKRRDSSGGCHAAGRQRDGRGFGFEGGFAHERVAEPAVALGVVKLEPGERKVLLQVGRPRRLAPFLRRACAQLAHRVPRAWRRWATPA